MHGGQGHQGELRRVIAHIAAHGKVAADVAAAYTKALERVPTLKKSMALDSKTPRTPPIVPQGMTTRIAALRAVHSRGDIDSVVAALAPTGSPVAAVSLTGAASVSASKVFSSPHVGGLRRLAGTLSKPPLARAPFQQGFYWKLIG